MPTTFWGWVLFIANEYGLMFLKGAGVTFLIAVIGTIIGFVIGLIIAIVRTIPLEAKDHWLKRGALGFIHTILVVYIEVFRGTPMIVQAMVIYYGAQYIGIDMTALFAAIFIISINTGAYMAEIIRGGVISVDRGQTEGAHSIGMTHWQTMTCVVLPQAIRNIMPSIGNEFVINIKDSSVLNVISVAELFFVSKSAAGTYLQYFPAFVITCLIYLVMTFSVTRILLLVEKKLDGPNSYTIHGSQSMPDTSIKIHKGGKDNA